MTIRYQTNDNKYAQYRLIADEWSINTEDWAIADEGVYIENPEFVYVKTDVKDKILWAIKTDGDIFYGAGCPQQVKDYIEEKISSLPLDEYDDIVAFLSDYLGSDTTLKVMIERINAQIATKVDKVEGKTLIDENVANNFASVKNDEYLEVVLDVENKVLEGTKNDGNGTKFVNVPTENPISVESYIESYSWIAVKIDETNKIIEGITRDGKKRICDFDDHTKKIIRDIAYGSSDVIEISNLDSKFVSPVPVTITGEKGEPNAKYEFELPLSNDAYNIRFKFRITENLINQEKSAVIASVNGAQVTAVSIPLVQCVAPISFDYEGERPMVNWPTTYGGISFNNASVDKKICKQHLGQEAFSIKYLGTNSATIENTGEAIILTVGGVVNSYSFSDYPTVNELYAAISSNNDFELSYIAMDKRNSNELAIFTSITLRDTFYCDDKGSYGGHPDCDIQPRVDNPPFYLKYAVSNEWHQVEIIKIGNNIYSTCDGNVISNTVSIRNNHLILGGECGVLFKELEIFPNSSSDAEIKGGYIISSVNPYIAIFEAHGMYDGPAYAETPEQTEGGLSSQNIEKMDYILSDAKRKGYIPVSIKDIVQWCVAGEKLPKRCYTLIFDDVRWPVCLNLNLRCVFNRYGAKPALALITDRNVSITYNGETITKEEAVKICFAAGFDIVSHTHNHRSTYGLKPSQYKEWLRDDIYAAEKIGTDGCIIVFPGGATDEYMGDVMEDVGIKCGIGIPGPNPRNNTLRNRFFLSRIDISSGVDYGSPLSRLY